MIIGAQLCFHTFPSALLPFLCCVSYLPRCDPVYLLRSGVVLVRFQVCSHRGPGVSYTCPGPSVFQYLPRCVLVPAHYQLVDFLGVYLPVCVSMFFCYGKILAVAWRQRQRIEPVANASLARGSASAQVTAGAITQSSDATGTDNNQHPQEHALPGTTVLF